MIRKVGICSILLCLLVCGVADAFSFSFCGPHRFWIGPEFYYSKRIRDGGSRQSGVLYGVRGGYDRVVHNGTYLAIEGRFAMTHDFCGHTKSGQRLDSEKTDSQIEGRIGYSFCCFDFLTTFYGGYGYFYGTNKFHHPRTMPFHFHTWFDYIPVGIMIQRQLCDYLTVGTHFKAKWMNEGQCKVTNDPNLSDMHMLINNEMQYEIEFPIYTPIRYGNRCWDLQLIPFYRYRHLGGRENYPCDYKETRFHSFGTTVTLQKEF